MNENNFILIIKDFQIFGQEEVFCAPVDSPRD